VNEVEERLMRALESATQALVQFNESMKALTERMDDTSVMAQRAYDRYVARASSVE
jgi:hypothetical protein